MTEGTIGVWESANESSLRLCRKSAELNAEKNDRWRFHMSMKLLNTAVITDRLSSGVGVSSEAMIGVRKC